MERSFCEYGLDEFTRTLASEKPVPGGGGAAALCAALAASLCSMAARLTRGKEKYAAFEPDMERLAAAAENSRRELISLIDSDAAGFLSLTALYSMPKTEPGRAELLREKSLEAAAAPMAMLRQTALVTALLEEAFNKCAKTMLSDVGCAAALSAAALEAAAMNVFVNTRTLKGGTEAEKLSREAREILGEYAPRARALTSAITEYLTEES